MIKINYQHLSIIAALCLTATLASCNAMAVSVDNFKVRNIRPNMLAPLRSSFDLNYDLLVESKNDIPVPIPVDGFNVGVYVEGERAADSKLPPGVTTVKVGKPITLSNRIVLGSQQNLAQKIPLIANKGRWSIKIDGNMNLQGYSLPVNYKTDIANPIKKGGSLIPGF